MGSMERLSCAVLHEGLAGGETYLENILIISPRDREMHINIIKALRSPATCTCSKRL